ncbi:hypothetical protein SESBI_34120 [Sesbania bispinosa]|nr:hypothetical protein SESBI_34120 [Sesbania bispinosa]
MAAPQRATTPPNTVFQLQLRRDLSLSPAATAPTTRTKKVASLADGNNLLTRSSIALRSFGSDNRGTDDEGEGRRNDEAGRPTLNPNNEREVTAIFVPLYVYHNSFFLALIVLVTDFQFVFQILQVEAK